jgi:hypothetical protein
MRCYRSALIGFLALSTVAVSAGALSPAAAQDQCFLVDQFQSWRAPDANTIYVRVLVDKYYRLDLGRACPAIKEPNVHLITVTRGPDRVCSAVDWDLSVSQGPPGFAVHCIVKTMTLLGPGEVAAIPKPFKP